MVSRACQRVLPSPSLLGVISWLLRYMGPWGEFGKRCFCSVTLLPPWPRFSFCFGLFFLSCFAFSCSMWLMVAGLMCDNYFLRCLEALSSKEGELQHLCAVLYIISPTSILNFHLHALFLSLEWLKKASVVILFLPSEFPQHNSQLCWSFGELPLWLLAKLSNFLLPLLDKHHVH